MWKKWIPLLKNKNGDNIQSMGDIQWYDIDCCFAAQPNRTCIYFCFVLLIYTPFARAAFSFFSYHLKHPRFFSLILLEMFCYCSLSFYLFWLEALTVDMVEYLLCAAATAAVAAAVPILWKSKLFFFSVHVYIIHDDL